MSLDNDYIETLKDGLGLYRKGKLTPEQFAPYIAAANVFHKAINQKIHTATLYEKEKKIYNMLERQGIVDSTAHINIGGDPEIDKVKCPEHKDLITRQECLDYSGEAKHFDECNGCEIGKATKEILSRV